MTSKIQKLRNHSKFIMKILLMINSYSISKFQFNQAVLCLLHLHLVFNKKRNLNFNKKILSLLIRLQEILKIVIN